MMELTDDNKANELYEKIKEIILEKDKNSSFKYNSFLYLAERDVEEEIKKQYISEVGEVTFENINGDLVTVKISRWHQYKFWSRYSIYEVPSFIAEIYVGNELIWKLTSYCKDSFNGECSENNVTSLDIPLSILQEKEIPLPKNNEDQINEEKNEIKKDEIIPQETRILFDEIANLNDKYKKVETQKEKLLLKREKDIKAATKKIMKSYSEKLKINENEITSVKKELDNFDALLIKYSMFNLDLIGNILQQLISITENEEYLYKKVNHIFKKRVHGVMDSWDEDVKTYVNIIIKKDKLKDNYESLELEESKIDKLVREGDALLLSKQDINDKKDNGVTFYKLEEEQVQSNIDFGKFDYVKDFIDNIIQYRFQNRMDKITEKEMLLFLQNYIIEHKEEIVKKYSSKFDSKVLKLKTRL